MVAWPAGAQAPSDAIQQWQLLNAEGQEAFRIGDYRKSVALVQQALRIARQMFGERDPRTLTTVNNLADAYRAQGLYSEAESLHREALQAYRDGLARTMSIVATGAAYADIRSLSNSCAAGITMSRSFAHWGEQKSYRRCRQSYSGHMGAETLRPEAQPGSPWRDSQDKVRLDDAPDIAFLKIPEGDARNLEAAGAIFYNLSRARAFAPTKSGHRMSKCYAVVGVVGEWIEVDSASSTRAKKVEIGGLFGAAKNVREFQEDGTDLVTVEIDHAAGLRIPKSYGGVSGGALWELHVELDEDLKTVNVNKRLHGVAFRESEDRKHITSNAAPSIDAIVNQIAAKWPESKG
jgi:Tetratricopeptide repeat